MSTSRPAAVARRALPWVGLWLGLRAAVAIGGWLVARRTDIGDESTATIRRTRTGSTVLAHRAWPHVARAALTVVFALALVDLVQDTTTVA